MARIRALGARRRARYLAHLRARLLSKRKTMVHTISKNIGKPSITITNNIWLPIAMIRKYGLRKVVRMTSSFKNRASLAALRKARYLARRRALTARRRARYLARRRALAARRRARYLARRRALAARRRARYLARRRALAARRRARYLARKRARAARRKTGRCSYVGKDNRFLGGYPKSTGRRVFR